MMKKLIILLSAFFILTGSFASTSPRKHPSIKASDIMIPIGKDLKISLLELSTISVKDVEALRGEKLNFADRLIFKSAQKKIRSSINRDGTLDSKKITKALKKRAGETGFHIGGFALGFFLGAIGVVIAYVINDDFKRNRVKWAWIGLATFVVLYIALILLLI